MSTLRQRHGCKRIRANVVYNEYIADKTHIHMNATRFTTLSGFVQYLGQASKVVVDETELGWYITYIDRDPTKMAAQRDIEAKKKDIISHEDRNRLFIKQQMKASQKSTWHKEEKEEDDLCTEYVKQDVGLVLVHEKKEKRNTSKRVVMNVFNGTNNDIISSTSGPLKKRKTFALDAIMEEKKSTKMSKEKKENWIAKNIIVKIMDKHVGDGKYYKQKARIIQIHESFVAQVQLLEEPRDELKIDQEDLETVIPQVQRLVKIVNGRGRGEIATLLAIQTQQFTVRIRIETGEYKGTILDRVEYEDICKLYES